MNEETNEQLEVKKEALILELEALAKKYEINLIAAINFENEDFSGVAKFNINNEVIKLGLMSLVDKIM